MRWQKLDCEIGKNGIYYERFNEMLSKKNVQETVKRKEEEEKMEA